MANKKKKSNKDQRYLDACKGQRCYFNVKCSKSDYADPTVVPCHSNFSIHGKGMGIKAHDKYTVPGCYKCHHWFDFGGATYDDKFDAFAEALSNWELDRVISE